jgi:hypothetical protein
MELYVCESVNPKMCTHTEPYTRDTHTATFLLVLPPIPISQSITYGLIRNYNYSYAISFYGASGRYKLLL